MWSESKPRGEEDGDVTGFATPLKEVTVGGLGLGGGRLAFTYVMCVVMSLHVV